MTPKLTQTQTELQFYPDLPSAWSRHLPVAGPWASPVLGRLQTYYQSHSPARPLSSSHFIDGKTEGYVHLGKKSAEQDSNPIVLSFSLLPDATLPQCFPGMHGIWGWTTVPVSHVTGHLESRAAASKHHEQTTHTHTHILRCHCDNSKHPTRLPWWHSG